MKELDIVVLTQDLPQLELQVGDIGTIVMTHGEDAGFEVEFCTLDGETVALETLLPSQIRPITRGEIAHVRKLPAIVDSH
ncbi:DUF4926 domain-containing protein [Dyadobacter endophyticus]|uniref:DUF4926 domain-containing protein n=1 Tax=Dyadobacter endophyticus TaxID=1749036 RepID=A0ABQ1YLB2_9BACT|nr:DUF4926 domain-containing protein [Dyadobacter endophyticus]GGH28364.1 DUF4926 domain-containing protein [Dyadobacter endophyticus]